MARQFGNYVHLHIANYYEHGTLTNTSKKSNFSDNFLEQHHQHLIDLIKQQQITELDQIQEAYNKQNENAWDFFKSIDKTSLKGKGILQHLLKQINSTWTSEMIEAIIQGLSWDNSKNTFVYKQTPSLIASYKTGLTGLPSLRLDSKASFHYVQTILNYIQKFLDFLAAMKKEEGDEEGIIGLDVNALTTLQNQLISLQENMKAAQLTERKIDKLNTDQLSLLNLKNSVTLKQYLEQLVIELNNRRAKYVSAAEINKQIQQAIAEMCGNIVATSVSDMAIEEIKKAINSAISVGRSGSKIIDGKENNPSIVSLNTVAVEMDRVLSNDLTSTKITGGSADSYFTYELSEMGASRAQKRDVTLTLNEKEYGISVKNTNFANAISKELAVEKNLFPSTISLQDSSVLLYLLGIEQDSPNLGTHYLNLISKHEDQAFADKIQLQALNNLKLYILYSSMTGQGQLRNKGFANILAIYDKGRNVPRVKLFDMSKILLSLDKNNFTEGVKFSPDLNGSFLLENNRIPGEDWNYAISARLTSVIMNARNKNVSTALYTSWLRDSFK